MAEAESGIPDGIRWELIAHDDGSGAWSWRRLGADGAIVHTSEPLSSFGKAIRDAMIHGFSPSAEHWLIKSGGWITHFTPGSAPITITPDDRVVPRQSPQSSAQTENPGAPEGQPRHREQH